MNLEFYTAGGYVSLFRVPKRLKGGGRGRTLKASARCHDHKLMAVANDLKRENFDRKLFFVQIYTQ